MEEEREVLTLESYKGGALIEQFNRALKRVVDNLADINTTDKPREITLMVKVTPNRDRTFLELVGGVKCKLAGQESVKATADLTFDDQGRAIARVRRSRQQEIPFNVHKGKEGGNYVN